MACGTPVLTFRTGGSPEMLNEKTGLVVEDDIEAIAHSITSVCENKMFDTKACINKAQEYNSTSKFMEYLRLFSLKYE